MQDVFKWTKKSVERNALSSKYEPIQPFLFQSFIEFSQASVVFDIGANVGLYSLFSSIGINVEQIFSFEPEECAFKELRENIALNGLTNLIHPLCKLVSNANTKCQFGVHSELSGINGVIDSSIHDKNLYKEVRELDGVRLDTFCNLKNTPIALKIDVEGHELHVLKGAEALLRDNPTFIQIEHYIEYEVDNLLSSYGYFRFHSAGHDHYFSNIKNFSSIDFVNRAIGHAHAMLIDYKTGALVSKRLMSQCLKLNTDVSKRRLLANAVIGQDGFFEGAIEYAFYLLLDGEKCSTKWYSQNNSCEFKLLENHNRYSLKCFVREVKNPKKMISKEVNLAESIKTIARAAISESFASPVKDIDKSFYKSAHTYELDFYNVLKPSLEKYDYSVIIVGTQCDERVLSSFPPQIIKNFTFIQLLDMDQSKNTDKPEIITVFSDAELLDVLKKTRKDSGERYCYFILDELFSYLSLANSFLENLVDEAHKGDLFVCQALTNTSYRDSLKKMTCAKGLEFRLIYPKSSIFKHEQKQLNSSNEVFGKLGVSDRLNFSL